MLLGEGGGGHRDLRWTFKKLLVYRTYISNDFLPLKCHPYFEEPCIFCF